MLKLALIKVLILLPFSAFSQPLAKSWEESLSQKEAQFKKLDERIAESEKDLERNLKKIILIMSGGNKKEADDFYKYLIERESTTFQKIREQNKDKNYYKEGKKAVDDVFEIKIVDGREVLRPKKRREIFENLKKKDYTTMLEMQDRFKSLAKRNSGQIKNNEEENNNIIEEIKPQEPRVQVEKTRSVESPEVLIETKGAGENRFYYFLFTFLLILLLFYLRRRSK